MLIPFSTICGGLEDISVCTAFFQPPKLTMQCPSDTVVVAAVFGGVHNPPQPSQCDYVEGDCIGEISSSEVTNCMWKESTCDIAASATAFIIKDPCYQPANYLMATDIQCIKRSMVHFICDEELGDIEGLIGYDSYILSPGYPWSYGKNKRKCTRRLVAPPGHGLYIRSVDVDIEKDGDTCKDYLTASLSPLKYCGKETISLDVRSSEVVLTFNYDDVDKTNRGFLLKLGVFESNDRDRKMPTGAPEVSSGNEVDKGEFTPISPPNPGNKPGGGKEPEIVMIVLILAIVIPLVMILLLALVIVYLCRRWRRRPEGTPYRRAVDSIVSSHAESPAQRTGNEDKLQVYSNQITI